MIRVGARVRRSSTQPQRLRLRSWSGLGAAAAAFALTLPAAPLVTPASAHVSGDVLTDVLSDAPGRATGMAGSRVTASDTVRSATRWYDYGAATPREVTCSELACVHRAVQGRHAASAAWASATLERLGTAWKVLVEQRGFPAPAASAAEDGDPRFHVYLADLGTQFYGMTVMGDPVPGHPRRVQSHLVVDNDMAGFTGDREENLAATVAHEFFHAIGVNTDLAADLWFAEASATWAETQVFPGSRVNRGYLSEGQSGRPSVPLDHPDGGYGNFPLLERLTASAGPDAVRQVWERLGRAGNRHHALTAIESVLAARGVAWSRFYSQYALANALPRQNYPARLRGTPAAPGFSVTLGRSSKTRSQARRLPHLTSHTSVVRLSSSVKKARVAVAVKSSKATHTSATLVVVRRDGTLRTVALRFNSAGKARATVTYTRSKVARLVLVTANTSLAFRDCDSGTGWSCDGVPVHDRTRVEVRTRTL